jgi:hypothetical protein
MLLWSCLCTPSQWRVTKEWLAIFSLAQAHPFEWLCGANICFFSFWQNFRPVFSSIASMFKSRKSQNANFLGDS